MTWPTVTQTSIIHYIKCTLYNHKSIIYCLALQWSICYSTENFIMGCLGSFSVMRVVYGKMLVLPLMRFLSFPWAQHGCWDKLIEWYTNELINEDFISSIGSAILHGAPEPRGLKRKSECCSESSNRSLKFPTTFSQEKKLFKEGSWSLNEIMRSTFNSHESVRVLYLKSG